MTSPKLIPAAANDWQSQLRDTINNAEELLGALQLSPETVGYSDLAQRDFPLRVPHCFVQRMRPGDPDDPLLKQVLASGQEMLAAPGFNLDPVGETGASNRQPGLIQKYHGRVLLMVSSACAINCRYCFRRHFPYGDNQVSRREWQGVLEAVSADPSITEVILSGGDPLVVTDQHLAGLVDLIAAIPHVKRLRVHTRLPVVIPDRVTDGLVTAIKRPGLQTIVVIHCNHAQEIDFAVAQAMSRLQGAGVTLLNQAVLLQGVNDSVAAQVNLSESLFEAGVLPYYLHLLDKVQGAAHFDVPQQRAIELIEHVASRLPGYLVPRLVREIEGATAKVPITAQQA